MTGLPDWAARLEGFLAEQTRSSVRLTHLRQLTGGASRDTWAVDAEVLSGPEAGPQRLVLRRDLGGVIAEQALSREQEFRVLQAAHAAGVLVPRPRWLCADPAVLGVPFFLMDRLEGESVGRRVVREPGLARARAMLPRQMAEQLVLIHHIDPIQAGLDFLPRPPLQQSPAHACRGAAGRATADAGRAASGPPPGHSLAAAPSPGIAATRRRRRSCMAISGSAI